MGRRRRRRGRQSQSRRKVKAEPRRERGPGDVQDQVRQVRGDAEDPRGVDVFRCPKCAAKLRVPVASGGASGGAFAGKPEKEKEKEPPARTSPGRAAKELSEVARRRAT